MKIIEKLFIGLTAFPFMLLGYWFGAAANLIWHSIKDGWDSAR